MLGWLWLVLRVVAPSASMRSSSATCSARRRRSERGYPYFLFFLCGMTPGRSSSGRCASSLSASRGTGVWSPASIFRGWCCPCPAVAPGLLYLAILVVVLAITVVFFCQQRRRLVRRDEHATVRVRGGGGGLSPVCGGDWSVDVGAAGALPGRALRVAVYDAVLVSADAGRVSDVERFPADTPGWSHSIRWRRSSRRSGGERLGGDAFPVGPAASSLGADRRHDGDGPVVLQPRGSLLGGQAVTSH